MVISDFKDLKKLLELCRKQGIEEMDFQGMKFKFGPLPTAAGAASDTEIESDNPYANFPDGTLSPEQLMFYSAGGRPEDDPALKDSQ